jgi:hypothetical protein
MRAFGLLPLEFANQKILVLDALGYGFLPFTHSARTFQLGSSFDAN